MATFNLDDRKAQLFVGKPDKDLTVTIDGVDHVWTFKNSGLFLSSEIQRCSFQIAELARNIKSLEGQVEDEAAVKMMDEYMSAIERLQNAFKAQVVSADGSSDKWIKEVASQPDVMINLIQQMIKSLKEQNGD